MGLQTRSIRSRFHFAYFRETLMIILFQIMTNAIIQRIQICFMLEQKNLSSRILFFNERHQKNQTPQFNAVS